MRKVIAVFLTFVILSGCAPIAIKRSELSDTQFLMDTICSIRVGGVDYDALKTAVADAFNIAYEVAADTDYYSDASDVSAINSAKANQEVKVSAHTTSILSIALDICEKSHGALDITIAPVKDKWGFDKGEHCPPEDYEVKSALSYVDYKKIKIDKDNNIVIKEDDNTKIDLGACAKGYAADCVLQALKSHNVEYALIDFGGNIITYGKNPSKRTSDWVVGIQKPFDESGEYYKTVTANNCAVVTSGTYQRYFEWDNKKYHHILDSSTGYPVDNRLASATVIHSSGLVADCLSTACIALGEEKGEKLAKSFGAEIVFIYEE